MRKSPMPTIRKLAALLAAAFLVPRRGPEDGGGAAVIAFVVVVPRRHHGQHGRRRDTASTLVGAGSSDTGDYDSINSEGVQRRTRIEERTLAASLVEAAMGLNGGGAKSGSSSSSSPLTEVRLAGQTKLPTAANRTSTCAVLAASMASEPVSPIEDPTTALPCLLLPLDGQRGGGSSGRLKLLEFAAHGRKQSKSVMLGLNSLFVNRDGGLFDELPWSAWGVDPRRRRDRDAAGNPIDPKFHLGKRDAYNRMMGKDWQGKSLAVGNLALRLKYSLESENADTGDDDDDDEMETRDEKDGGDEDDSQLVLARRILELRVREAEMEVAECDYDIAVAAAGKMSRPDDDDGDSPSRRELDELRSERQARLDDLEAMRSRLAELATGSDGANGNGGDGDGNGDSQQKGGSGSGLLTELLQEIADWTTGYGENAAPYRGAIGYAPVLDSRSDVEDSQLMQYASPYDLVVEILRDQLNAEVIGCVLENASLLQGSAAAAAVGGAVVLRRITPKKTVTIAGETLEVGDEEEDFGSEGIRGGETIVVECDADEAIGMSLASEAPLRVETGIWERASVMAEPVVPSAAAASSFDDDGGNGDAASSSVRTALPLWKPVDPELSILVEGQAGNLSATERVYPLRIPRTTVSLFDSLFDPTTSSPKEMFPTDNPVQSLSQYDNMSNQDKAVTLLAMSNFDGKLPRPRVLRQSESSGDSAGGNALDKLLLPLVDESVRRQYLVRDAVRRGDFDEAEALKREKSRRQEAKELAEQALERGEDDLAEYYQREADLYGSLRADVTQDEGSYSRFLDRDEWYERTRAQQAKKLDRKQFGTLLDGIE